MQDNDAVQRFNNFVGKLATLFKHTRTRFLRRRSRRHDPLSNNIKFKGSVYTKLTSKLNVLKTKYYNLKDNEGSIEPIIFLAIITSNHSDTIMVEIVLHMENGQWIPSIDDIGHPHRIHKKSENIIHIFRVDTTLFDFTLENVSKLQWVIQECDKYINHFLSTNNITQHVSIEQYFNPNLHDLHRINYNDTYDSDSDTCNSDIYCPNWKETEEISNNEDVWTEETKEFVIVHNTKPQISSMQNEIGNVFSENDMNRPPIYFGYNHEHRGRTHRTQLSIHNSGMENCQNLDIFDCDTSEIDLEMVMFIVNQWSVIPVFCDGDCNRRGNHRVGKNNANQQPSGQSHNCRGNHTIDQECTQNNKLKSCINRIHGNLAVLSDADNECQHLAESEAAQDNEEQEQQFIVNEQLEEERQPIGINEVENLKKLDSVKLYDNILNMGNGFNDCYADGEDNILDMEQKVENNQNNAFESVKIVSEVEQKPKLDKDGHIQINEDEDDFKYDEQKEGYTEVINEKTILFPREYKNIGPVFSYGKSWVEGISAEYSHLKNEVLHNKYAPITEKTWNGILKKCNKILKGQFSSKRKNRWSKLLRDNKIGMKNLVALKLYTDFDLLQREFRKSFRAPYNKKEERLKSFFHWRQALQETFKKFSNIPSALSQPTTLFHGINSIMCLDQYEGIYYGPCSTTTDLHVARSFAGKNGMILVMKPQHSLYKVLDISWISDYPDEREYLLLDHTIEIETWILSSDYDQYYHYYHGTLTKKKVMKGPSGHLSYPSQKQIPKNLVKLKGLIKETEVKSTKSATIKIKQNLDFDKADSDLDSTEKIDLLIWMFQFALGYKYGKKKPSKFDQSLNANIQHVMKQIHIMQVPPKLVNEFMDALRTKYKKEMSAYFIRSVLNEYFINTYCPLDAAMQSTV